MSKQKRGVALIWTLILSTILLVVSSTMVNFISQDSKMSARIDSSSIAYAAAKSGIEVAKDIVNQKVESSDSNRTFNKTIIVGKNGSTDITATISGEVERSGSSENWKISSIGYLGEVARRLEYKIVDVTKASIPFADLDKPLTDVGLKPNGSYEQNFAFWFPAGSSLPNRFNFGLGDTVSSGGGGANNNGIWMRFGQETVDCGGVTAVHPIVRLAYKSNTSASTASSKFICLTSSNGINLSDYDGNNNKFYVTIKYVNNTSAQLILSSYSFSGRATCIDTINLSMDSSSLSNLSSRLNYVFYWMNPPGDAPQTKTQVETTNKFRYEFSSGATKVQVNRFSIVK